MAKPLHIFLLILVFLGLILANQSLYVIDARERAVVLRFGEVVIDNVQPGLHMKIPFMDQLRIFDSRVQTLDAQPEEFITKEKKALVVDSFVKWQVFDVPKFYTATNGQISTAERLIASRVNTGLRNQFGERTVIEVVSGERDQLMQELVSELQKLTEGELGVKIIDIRVRKINLPETVSRSVFERMITERERLARELRSEGREQAEAIRADADKQKLIIESDAYEKSEVTRGEGDAIATQAYAESFQTDSDFFQFYRSLKAYEETFTNKEDLFVIEPNSDFFNFMQGIEY